MTNTDYYLRDASEIVGVTTGYLRRMIRDGRIDAVQYECPNSSGYAYAIPKKELERLLDESKFKTVGAPKSRPAKGL